MINIERRDSAPRLQAFEQVDQANADAAWEQHEAYQRHVNAACAAIRAMPFAMVDAAYIGQVLDTLSCKAAEGGLVDVAEEIAVLATGVTP